MQIKIIRHHYTPTAAAAAAAAAKFLQLCPTLCSPRDSSPPDSSVPAVSRQEHWSELPFPSPIHLLEWQRSRTLMPPNAGEDVEQQEFSFIGYRNAKQYRYFGKQFSDIL